LISAKQFIALLTIPIPRRRSVSLATPRSQSTGIVSLNQPTKQSTERLNITAVIDEGLESAFKFGRQIMRLLRRNVAD